MALPKVYLLLLQTLPFFALIATLLLKEKLLHLRDLQDLSFALDQYEHENYQMWYLVQPKHFKLKQFKALRRGQKDELKMQVLQTHLQFQKL